MREEQFAELSVIGMKGCESFCSQVDYYLKEWRRHGEDKTFLVKAECPRFSSGEAKALLHESLRGHDLYIISDVFNYGVTYKMYGMEVPMSPDDHYADLKRIIAANMGKARRITVIMPMLYEGRQHKRSARESLDCALMLQELINMGVTNIITFDAHDPRVQNAIPLNGFETVQPAYQFIIRQELASSPQSRITALTRRHSLHLLTRWLSRRSTISAQVQTPVIPL